METFETMMKRARAHVESGNLEAARAIARDLSGWQLSVGHKELLREFFTTLNPREQVYQTAETFVTI